MATATNELDQRGLRNIKLLLGLAIAGVLVAVLAGLALLVFQPGDGSTAEAALGFTAAIGGLAVAVFAIAAAVYAQAKNLWRFAPTPVRVVLWVFIGVGIAITLWNLISQPFRT